MDWNNYNLKSYGYQLDETRVMMLGDEIFRKHDTNNSGTLEIAEFPFMIDDFF